MKKEVKIEWCKNFLKRFSKNMKKGGKQNDKKTNGNN